MNIFLNWCDRLAERLKPHGVGVLVIVIGGLYLYMLLLSLIQLLAYWLFTYVTHS